MQSIANYAATNELCDLFNEYVNGTSLEAKMVHWVDALCTILRSLIDSARHPETRYGTFDGFWIYTLLRIGEAPEETRNIFDVLN